MAVKMIGEGKFYELQVYRGEGNLENEAMPFSGSLRQHYNPNMVLLLINPASQHGMVYEFRLEDVLHAEEQPSITRPDGITVEIVRLWVKKGSVAMRMEPVFVNEELV